MRPLSIVVLCLLASPALAAPPSPSPPSPTAPPAPSASTRPTYARANRLAINLGFGFGSGSLGGLSDDMTVAVNKTNALQVSAPHSSIQINAEIAFRYYAPFYIMGQVGADCVYNKASSSLPPGYSPSSLSNDNLVIEVPILVGGYYPFFGRLYVFGAVGPAILVYPRVFWDPGMDFKADVGVGAHVLVGADFMLTDHVSIGLELRYRYAKSGELKEKNYDVIVTRGNILGDGSTATYNLDLSGISLGINLRFFAL
jgi:opacity protein-like surface antigen